MELADVPRICALLKCTALVGISSDGSVRKIDFYHPKRGDILKHWKELKLGRLKKKYWTWSSDIDWEIGNVRFNKAEVCEIISYEEVVVPAVPAHVERKPIYRCEK